ncbi:MAG: amidohydrolase [Chloroflexi bacterium]|nr:amidohydrolase [Chloroflexota bacterium]
MIILHHGKIRTLNVLQPLVEALAIQGERILAVGRNEDIINIAAPDAWVIDLHGQTILPGFTDSHIHLLQYGLKLSQIDCETISRAECLTRVAKKVQATAPGTWITGQGWNHNIWQEGIGHKHDLDHISNLHPIFLAAKSLHASWCNSAALQLAGIDRHTPDPPGGTIVKDENREPTGILLESASNLVEACIPPLKTSQKREVLLDAQQQLLRYGITSVHDVDNWEIYALLQELQPTFFIRVTKSFHRSDLKEIFRAGLNSGSGNDRLNIGWLKLFMDGALGPQTAAMLLPYEGTTSHYGMLTLSAEELFEIGMEAAHYDIRLEIHAIGDKAIHITLDKIEQLASLKNTSPLPHRMEHVQIIHPPDIQRMAHLQMVASMQPIHVISDMDTADRYWGKRCAFSYAWHSIDETGIPLIFGSDAPVETPNPFPAIQAALTRQKSSTSQPWFPQQRLSLSRTLAAYISRPPAIIGKQHSLGQLQPGFLADLVVLPDDVLQIDPFKIAQVSPSATMISGEFRWMDDHFLMP